MASSFPVAGKVALVTGGARGIGFETARLLHSRGASVAILDSTPSRRPTPARRSGSERVEHGGHVVVVVASIYAFLNGVLATPYAIGKAGVEQLGRSLRTELAPHGASASVALFGFIDTPMVQAAFEDPLAKRIEEIFPAPMLRRLHPSEAGEAIVERIENRAPRIIRPKWWRILSVMRGVINPLIDRTMERDPRTRAAVLDGEARGRAESGAE